MSKLRLFSHGHRCIIASSIVMLASCGNKEPTAPVMPSVQPFAKAELDSSVNRQQLELGPLEPTCSVEGVVGLTDQTRFPADASATYAVPLGSAVKMIGFGANKSKGRSLGAFTAYLASTHAVYKVSGQTTLERPDVVSYFKAPDMLRSGFHIDVDLTGIPAGDYAVMLRPSDGAVCPTHYTLRIT